jgi:uncharacterized membrane protein
MIETYLGTVGWFPQDYAHTLFIAKGTLALAATLLVVMHMAHTWNVVVTRGQRLRYMALLYLTANVAFASVEQVGQDLLVSYRHLSSTVGTVVVIAAMVISIVEDRRRFARP